MIKLFFNLIVFGFGFVFMFVALPAGGVCEARNYTVINKTNEADPLPGQVYYLIGAPDTESDNGSDTKPGTKKAEQKPLTKYSAFNKYIELDCTKDTPGGGKVDNRLVYRNPSSDKISYSDTPIAVFVRDTLNYPRLLPSNTSDFAQLPDESEPGKYNWIVKPLSHVYTILPMDSRIDSLDIDDDDDFNKGTHKYVSRYSFYWPATLKLKYNKYMSDPYETVSVLYRKNDREPWEILPCSTIKGTSQLSKNLGEVEVTFAKNGFGSYCVANIDTDFLDFRADNSPVTWAQQYVKALWAKGIMSQTGSNGYFGLYKYQTDLSEYRITRGEFAWMLVKGMRLPLESNEQSTIFSVNEKKYDTFADIDNDNSTFKEFTAEFVDYYDYYPDWPLYAITAAKYGLFNGIRHADGDLYFEPAALITREQAAALIARAAKLKVDKLEPADTNHDAKNGKIYGALSRLYTDADAISPWAMPYVLAVSKAKYMEGIPDSQASGGTVRTGAKAQYKFGTSGNDQYITRAQAAKITYKLLEQLKLIN